MKLEGSSISLLPAQSNLAQAVSEYYSVNRAFLEKFEPKRSEEFFTLRFQESQLVEEEQLRSEKRGYRFYLVENAEPQKVIGTISLSNVVWKAFCSCFMGYGLDAEHGGRGYMTEAVSLVTKHAFEELGLHRIEANVMPRNKASLRVLEKNGYENEGMSRKYLNINGVWEDHIHMVALNEKGQTNV